MGIAILRNKSIDNAVTEAKAVGKKAIDSARLILAVAGLAILLSITALMVAITR